MAMTSSVVFCFSYEEFPVNVWDSLTSYPFENDDPLLVVFIGGDVKHGSSITWHNGVLHFGISPDVQVMSFDSTDSRSHCRGLGYSQVKETCQQTNIRLDSHRLVYYHHLTSGGKHWALHILCPLVSHPPQDVLSAHRQAADMLLSEVSPTAIGMTLFNFDVFGHEGCSAPCNWLAQPVRSTNTQAQRLWYSHQQKSLLRTWAEIYHQKKKTKKRRSVLTDCHSHLTIGGNSSSSVFFFPSLSEMASWSNNSICLCLGNENLHYKSGVSTWWHHRGATGITATLW